MSDSKDDSVYTIDRVLAVHVSGTGVKTLLIKWQGHFVLTWLCDEEDKIDHKLTCSELKPGLEDDAPEFQKSIGPEACGMFAGDLHPLSCCGLCQGDCPDGLDYRVYVDASDLGNVRVLIIAYRQDVLTILHRARAI